MPAQSTDNARAARTHVRAALYHFITSPVLEPEPVETVESYFAEQQPVSQTAALLVANFVTGTISALAALAQQAPSAQQPQTHGPPSSQAQPASAQLQFSQTHDSPQQQPPADLADTSVFTVLTATVWAALNTLQAPSAQHPQTHGPPWSQAQPASAQLQFSQTQAAPQQQAAGALAAM